MLDHPPAPCRQKAKPDSNILTRLKSDLTRLDFYRNRSGRVRFLAAEAFFHFVHNFTSFLFASSPASDLAHSQKRHQTRGANSKTRASRPCEPTRSRLATGHHDHIHPWSRASETHHHIYPWSRASDPFTRSPKRLLEKHDFHARAGETKTKQNVVRDVLNKHLHLPVAWKQ